VSELTARTNDDGWESIFVEWLKGSHLNNKDGVFVLSVGGGNQEKMLVSIWYGLWNMLKRQGLE